MSSKVSDKAQKPPRRPTKRQSKTLAGLKAGKSLHRAALDAGYAESTAKVACRDVLPRIEKNFRTIMRDHIPAEKIAKRIAEGMDATEKKIFCSFGEVIESKKQIAWSERRQSTELAARLTGFHVPTTRVETVEDVDPKEKLRELLARHRKKA